MRCSGHVNVVEIDVRLYDKLLEKVDCFKYLRSQVVANKGCEINGEHRRNDNYKAC